MGFRQTNFDYFPDYSVYRYKGTDVYICVYDKQQLREFTPAWLRYKPDRWAELVETIDQIEERFLNVRPFGISLHILSSVVQVPDNLARLCQLLEIKRNNIFVGTHYPANYNEALSPKKYKCLAHTFQGKLSGFFPEFAYFSLQLYPMGNDPEEKMALQLLHEIADSPEGHHLMGLYHHKHKRLVEAQENYRSALKRDPAHLGATYQLARILHWDSTEEAISLYERTLLLRPDHINGYLELAHAHAWQGNHTKAKQTVEFGRNIIAEHWERQYMGAYLWLGDKRQCIKKLGRSRLSSTGRVTQDLILRYSTDGQIV